MHIPDGFLSPEVALACAVPAAAAVAIGLRRANTDLDERRVPLLGVTAAFVFAAQMLNFPVAGGTSGHFLGAALAAILLGPWLACLTLAVVLGVQALLFADGGITALGANVFNMGVAGALVVGALMRAANAVAPKRLVTISAVGAWLAVMTGAALTAVELAASGTVPLGTVLPAMLGTHALIGVGEAAITLAAVSAVLATRPDLINQPAPVGRPALARPFVVVGLAVAIGLATAASPFASSHPDGLERVAEDKGFAVAGQASSGPISDYAFPGLDDARLATGLAGFAGTLAVFAVGSALVRGRRRLA
ncbi:energy-coupling factor ABC transporter permease [Solirubrobacter phytolaccae]|uniref:Energy-coupling factor ABC transporter permease n=1 Tax=Solirubrobacter phytolaccae TaxID=1404360 RepID=A0A9X3S791_9ACTN|nr:energy-coupling factor ABC transporter permease [Solirubrobacter phytolaccae]MDA0178866.1 energy-coupling factor ABC transporter permease [Solirubrobacter phytolaccae]